MSPESPRIPDWAQRERLDDMAWIAKNLHGFMPVALEGYAQSGRGALVVDTTQRPIRGRGHPYAYLPQHVVALLEDDDLQRMVEQYDPQREFVIMVLKKDRNSDYRIQVPPSAR
jgi:hypothetical protein